jgi:hypothetical protein
MCITNLCVPRDFTTCSECHCRKWDTNMLLEICNNAKLNVILELLCYVLENLLFCRYIVIKHLWYITRVYNTLSLVASLVMRTSPCWICTCHVLLHATSRLQLSHHVWFGFNRHPCTVSAISPLSNIETRHIRMCWKGDNNNIILVLVQAPEGSWFMLCDHNNVLHHFLLGQLRFVSSRAFNPSCGRPR